MFRAVGLLLLVVGLTDPGMGSEGAGKKLVVHEWGTFTSLQDEDGKAVGGINTDDEPVPAFVHQLRKHLLIEPTDLPPCFFQGAPHCHPDVTLRLETPVVYFYPPKPRSNPLTADVRVRFRRGWLTEFYPDAVADAPGLAGTFNFGHLASEHTGSLTWKSLRIGGQEPGPETSDHVWTSPRQVNAVSITSTGGESEKFLFYRGVGHVDAPLRCSQEKGRLVIRGQLEPSLKFAAPLRINNLWLADIRSDGRVAFRSVDPIIVNGDTDRIAATMPMAFSEEQYGEGNLQRLCAAMHAALVHEGLFGDEASALLRTWELSYFKSAGLRLFFLVPPAWVNHYLPLKVSLPAETKRVMIGRIELVTPQHRQLLFKIAAGPASDGRWRDELILRNRITVNPFTKIDAKIPIPEDYRAYINLGRFRNALVLDEVKRRPTKSLKQFIENYGLAAYEVKSLGLLPHEADR
jgi:hypothetical protein